MDIKDLFALRESFNAGHIVLCFNGPMSRSLIEEIGNALRNYMQSQNAPASAAMDVFGVYIEMAQNIRHYAQSHQYVDALANATVVIARDAEGRHLVSAGNIVELADGRAMCERVRALGELDKTQLKALYKEQLRKPRDEAAQSGSGLGLIDMARKASSPLRCEMRELDAQQGFLTLQVAI